MEKRHKGTKGSQKASSKSILLANLGIHTGAQFASLMSALLTDTITGRIDPRTSNAACNIGAKLLKVVELEFRYGKKVEGATKRVLALTPLAATGGQKISVQ